MGKFSSGDKFGLGRAFLKPSNGSSTVDSSDSQYKAKAQRFQALRRVRGSAASLRRAKASREQRSIAAQLRHSSNNPIHPLWDCLPRETRTPKTLLQLRRRRLWAWLKQKRQRIALVVLLYLLIWSIPLMIGEALLTVFAVLPLLLVPPVGYLVYWLVWKEFHA